jgi:hypothetical protein
MGVMPAYSRRPDGELAPGAFFYRDLSGGGADPPEGERAESAPIPPQPSP